MSCRSPSLCWGYFGFVEPIWTIMAFERVGAVGYSTNSPWQIGLTCNPSKGFRLSKYDIYRIYRIEHDDKSSICGYLWYKRNLSKWPLKAWFWRPCNSCCTLWAGFIWGAVYFLITSSQQGDHQSVGGAAFPVSVYVLCQGTGCQSPVANLYIENHVVQRRPGNCPRHRTKSQKSGIYLSNSQTPQVIFFPTHARSHFIPPVSQDLTAAAPNQRMDISKGRTQLFARRLGRPHQTDQRSVASCIV